MNVLGMYLALKGKGRKITLPNVLGLPTTEHHDHLSQYPKDQTCEFTPMYSTNTTADSKRVLIRVLWPEALDPYI